MGIRWHSSGNGQALSLQPVSQAQQEFAEVAGPSADIQRLPDATPTKYTVQIWTRLAR